MGRYFFDVSDGESRFHDTVGIDLSPVDIINETKSLLSLLAYERLPEGVSRTFEANVRNSLGEVVYRDTMRLNCS